MGDPVLYQHLFLNKWPYFLCDSDTKDLSALYSTLFEGIPTLSLVGNHIFIYSVSEEIYLIKR